MASVESYGNKDEPNRVVSDDMSGEILELVARVQLLHGKMDELYMRPRMAYTQSHSAGQILKLVADGNTEPDWVDVITTLSTITPPVTDTVPLSTDRTPDPTGVSTVQTTPSTISTFPTTVDTATIVSTFTPSIQTTIPG